MRILVVGLGALGSIYSCLLKSNGHEVWGVDQETLVQKIAKDGVNVHGIWGDHSAKLDGVGRITDMHGIYDIIIVCVKSFLTSEVTRSLQSIVSEDTYVILAQNGYGNYEKAIEYLGSERVVLARVIFGAETEGAGISKVTVIADDVLLGSPENVIDMRVLKDLADVFGDAGIPTRATDEIMKYVWGKIIYNCALNPLGAILETTYGQLAMDNQSKVIMDGIIKEIFEVLAVMKQETLWPNAKAYMDEFYDELIPATRNHHSSMLQDVQAGRRTEIDSLNGAVCELGKKYGVQIVANEMVRTMLKNKALLVNPQG
ncbi:MAG: 2-dehydropantoate 2-reductase [Bacillota bacterium]|nr:2-dehydropantoate 2-reductase [Bacillota bacterium]